MQTKSKVFIGCGFLLLIPVLALIGFYFYQTSTPEFQEYSKLVDIAREDGIYFGKTTDQYGCIQLAFSRMDEIKNPSRNQLVSNNAFVSECLQTSKPTPDFCQNVPKVMVKDWIRNQCKLIGRENSDVCYLVYDEKTTFCAGL